MSSTAAHALLGQLRRQGGLRALDGRDTDNAGWTWTAKAEDQAACALAGLMGFDLDDG